MLFTKRPQIIVLATSRKTRGGITSVVKAHEKGNQWKMYSIVWIETHQDKSLVIKIFILLRAFIKFIYFLPKARLIHAHMSLVNSAFRKSIFINIAHKFGKKIVIHFHPPGHNPDYLKDSYRRKYIKLFNKADLIIVLSDYWKQWVADEFGIKEKIEVVYNPCTYVHPEHYIHRENIILFAGSIIERKGYKDLLTAFSLISKEHNDWKLVFAGNGQIEKGLELANKLGIGDKVEFVGWIEDSYKRNLFSKSSIFCLPSYGEGFPMAILDAWGYGLPVVSSNVGGLQDILEDGVNSLVFTPGDTVGLSKKLNLLMTSIELRSKISAASLNLVKSVFSLQTINLQIERIYKRLIN